MMKFVTCNLMGGLGNQLFQIFATMSYSRTHNCEFIFEYSKQLTTGLTRYTFWDSILKSLFPYTSANVNNARVSSCLHKFREHWENGFQYTSIPKHSGYLRLCGYFQSYKYFEEHWDYIKRKISLPQQRQIVLEQYKHIFKSDRVVNLHFRLGDYKVKQDYHPIIPYEYYLDALKGIPTPEHAIYVCEEEDNQVVSDMIQRLQAEFPDTVFTKVDDSISDWEQMLIMSCCQTNIIANSSYSWWGAYISHMSDPNAVVCYPSLWFGPAAGITNTQDLFPPSWHKINVKV